ncbi:vitamin B6 photo-protection and homoeostasis-domain-containing protein [Glomus cerebriforme]|uniref:Vitamin B6 photo-protection and homoeostasis-domain-containing protein n=1 Tax=Glomus cerebriforme TaxID=658196 RepID=A0A397TMX5_9GLOM|nr:vitamin B6 photo-protection and homoeostasis-domain-containing protein [Glomus cerebriforme]
MNLNFTRKRDIWCKSLKHLSRTTIINTSNIIFTRQILNLQYKFSFRTLYHSNKNSNVPAHQSLRIKQHIGKLWRSKLSIISFPSDEKNESSKEPKMTYEQISFNSIKKISINDLILEGKRQMTSAFMPKGYPDSVTNTYWDFAKWQFFHNVAGSVTGVLSTQSLLYAMGLGASSIPLAAALNWIIKDGLGQLGGVIYAAFISDRFDSEPKRHRFQATVTMQIASILELLAPLWPASFLLIASVSNIGKNIAWLAGSATRAQMHKSFALRNNLGDITGKSGSQTTAACLIGTALGVVISGTITKYSPDIAAATSVVQPIIPIFLAFVPFSVFNIYANYKSSLYVTTNTLNIPRAEMIIYGLLNQLGGVTRTLPKINCDFENLIPSPKEISSEETFVGRYHSPFYVPLEIEPALYHYASKKHAHDLHVALKQKGFLHPEEYFILHVPTHHLFGNLRKRRHSVRHHPHRHLLLDNRQHLSLWFSQKADTRDMIKGFCHACVIRYVLEYADPSMTEDREQVLNIVRDTHTFVEDVFENFINTLMSKEWEIGHLFFIEKDDGRLFVEK